MAIGQQLTDTLPFLVECQHPEKPFFEVIAGFDTRSAAEAYAEQCRLGHTPDWTYRVANPYPKIDHASAIERRIVGAIVRLLLEAGYTIDVEVEREETVLTGSKDEAAIFAALGSSSFDVLWTYTPEGRRSFVDLVWGNDVDVLSDYGISLETVLKPALDLAEALDERGN